MRIRRLDHISFTVSDIERSARFFGRLGYETDVRYISAGADVDEGAAAERADMDIQLLRHESGGPAVELIRYLNYPTGTVARNHETGAAHIGFCVEDVRGAYEELSAAGVEFFSAPHTDEFGAVWVYLRDPDGNTVELLQDPPAS